MKKLILAIAVLTLFSCETESRTDSNDLNSNLTKTEKVKTNSTAKLSIFQASWDEWGRASKSCAGWGLCNFQSCWFCKLGKYTGKVEVDEFTMEGFLYVALDPTDATQAQAIKTQETFFVDQDINNSNAVVYKGEYKFDASIGNYGGYQIPVTVKDATK
ncbi:MAG: hypothetical protein MUW56_14065 [Chryseobacterium sp.]|uniref:hypothetical protein n=1 Tax=Chryseobacterium sp. TaxID=1871047 RepID=UPI0025C2F4ED|nr:hypothetical protein [Chryseobacterium sp.]MCJ7934712.1 hypothetical protein [Chryseobacterium sp.]